MNIVRNSFADGRPSLAPHREAARPGAIPASPGVFPRPGRLTGRDSGIPRRISAPRHGGVAQPPASVDAICDEESPDLRSTEYTNANAMTVMPNRTTAAAPTNGLVVLLAVPMT